METIKILLNKQAKLSSSSQNSVSEHMRIAICGTRGVPANYGGFETFAEELGSRLAAKGHEVTVYGRSNWQKNLKKYDEYKGIKTINLPTISHKYIETPLHTLICFLHSSILRHDVVLLCNGANSPFAWIPRLLGIRVLVNVDGIERARKKWNLLGKTWYRLGEFTSCLFSYQLVSDASYIRQYYLDNYATDSNIIRYGSKLMERGKALKKVSNDYSFMTSKSKELLTSFNLKPGGYILYVSRLEPENNADKVILAHNNLVERGVDIPLVIVGDAPYAEEYKKSLYAQANDKVMFLGYQFGEAYTYLQEGAYMYIQATEVGGTHPALVEAMGFANCIIANDVPEHREVMEENGLIYSFNDHQSLSNAILSCLSSEELVEKNKKSAYERAEKEFSWGSITDEYENLLREILNTP